MPLIGLKNELKERELKIIPAQGFPLTSMWHLVWLKQRTLSPVAQAFLNFIRNEKSSIMDAKFEWYRDFKG
jgi:DNA-binding transcriptional LysR family regulator